MIRTAKFADLPRLYELIVEMHGKSRYSGHVSVHEQTAKSLLMNAIRKHNGQHDGCTWVMVSENGGVVDGFIVGMLDRVYHIGTKLAAKDMFLYATAADAGALIDSFIDWAQRNPCVYEINLSWTDAVAGAERIEKLYERKGFTRCGAIFVRGN